MQYVPSGSVQAGLWLEGLGLGRERFVFRHCTISTLRVQILWHWEQGRGVGEGIAGGQTSPHLTGVLGTLLGQPRPASRSQHVDPEPEAESFTGHLSVPTVGCHRHPSLHGARMGTAGNATLLLLLLSSQLPLLVAHAKPPADGVSSHCGHPSDMEHQPQNSKPAISPPGSLDPLEAGAPLPHPAPVPVQATALPPPLC